MRRRSVSLEASVGPSDGQPFRKSRVNPACTARVFITALSGISVVVFLCVLMQRSMPHVHVESLSSSRIGRFHSLRMVSQDGDGDVIESVEYPTYPPHPQAPFYKHVTTQLRKDVEMVFCSQESEFFIGSVGSPLEVMNPVVSNEWFDQYCRAQKVSSPQVVAKLRKLVNSDEGLRHEFGFQTSIEPELLVQSFGNTSEPWMKYFSSQTRRFLKLLSLLQDSFRNFHEDGLITQEHSEADLWTFLLCEDVLEKNTFREYVRLEYELFSWIRGTFDWDSAPSLQSRYSSSVLNLLQEQFQANSTRGFVICAGENQMKYLPGLLWNMRFVHGCELPVEIFYLGDKDLSLGSRKLLEKFANVATRNIFNFVDQDLLALRGWDIKPFALLFSSFVESVLLDVDIALLQNPLVLFEQKGYVETGALFFRDRTIGQMNQQIPSIIKMIAPSPSANYEKSRVNQMFSSQEMESGVVVIDKRRVFFGMLGVCKLMDRLTREFLNNKCGGFYGDKEFYWVGFEMVQEPYTFSKWYAGALGLNRSVKVSFSPIGMERSEEYHDSLPTITQYEEQIAKTLRNSDFFRKLLSSEDPEPTVNPESSGIASVLYRMHLRTLDEKKNLCRVCGRMLHFDDEGLPLWWNGGFKYPEDEKEDSRFEQLPYVDVEVFDDGGNEDLDPVKEISLWTFDHERKVFCKDESIRKVRAVPEKQREFAEKAIQVHAKLRNLSSSQLKALLERANADPVNANTLI
jgi:hypothetical protein